MNVTSKDYDWQTNSRGKLGHENRKPRVRNILQKTRLRESKQYQRQKVNGGKNLQKAVLLLLLFIWCSRETWWDEASSPQGVINRVFCPVRADRRGR